MASLESALAFIHNFKRSLPNHHHYEAFSKALMDFAEGNLDRKTLVSKVSALVDGRPDLAAAFNSFLPEDCPKIPVAEKEKPARKRTTYDDGDSDREVGRRAVEFVNRVRSLLEDDVVYAAFLKTLSDLKAHKDVVEADKKMSNLFRRHPELYVEFTWFTADSWPENPPSAAAADDWSGREELLRRKKRAATKTPKRDTRLDDVEDALYESDMLFHSLESTAAAAGKQSVNETGRADLGKYYSPMNMRCIRRLYGEDGEHVIESLQTNPEAVSPVILHRLKEMVVQTRICRQQLRANCANALRNFHHTPPTLQPH
ncbi:unnamed protein product [Cuscuta campestris]|uniref:Histone deacetylase interacting domain-containing protein n=1 Tax=Cuscuta campestris TaxID=132261 RepID=A0A484MQJ1_9ASTE|nr:unnamed protein product [Cuscuta campestris]